MKILVTGGGGFFGQSFNKLNSDKFITPNRSELDLSNIKSIYNFHKNNRNIDGIILSAKINTVELHDMNVSDLLHEHLKNEFEKSYSENIYNNFLLCKLYGSKLKFIIYMTSTFEYDSYFGYRINKLAGERFFLGLKTTTEFKNTSIKVVNPGHMDSDETYNSVCNKLTNFIDDIHLDFIKDSDYFLLNPIGNSKEYVSIKSETEYKIYNGI